MRTDPGALLVLALQYWCHADHTNDKCCIRDSSRRLSGEPWNETLDIQGVHFFLEFITSFDCSAGGYRPCQRIWKKIVGGEGGGGGWCGHNKKRALGSKGRRSRDTLLDLPPPLRVSSMPIATQLRKYPTSIAAITFIWKQQEHTYSKLGIRAIIELNSTQFWRRF